MPNHLPFQIEDKHFIPKKYDISNVKEILTNREFDVFKCLCIEKLRPLAIAAKLGIDKTRVSHYITNISYKINKFGTDQFKDDYFTFLKQNKIQKDRKWPSKMPHKLNYPDGVFLTKDQMKRLLENRKKP